MGDITAIAIVGFIVLGIYKLFELFVRKSERIMLIEKFSLLSENNNEPLKIKLPFTSEIELGFWPLRISLLLIGIGAGCLLAFFIQTIYFNSSPMNSYREWIKQFRELVVLANFACISLMGGIGLFIAFLIEQKRKVK